MSRLKSTQVRYDAIRLAHSEIISEMNKQMASNPALRMCSNRRMAELVSERIGFGYEPDSVYNVLFRAKCR